MYGVAFFIGCMFGTLVLAFVNYAADSTQARDCARTHNVYACEKVVEYVPVSASQEGE